jgi:hypothetical protein
VSLSITCAAVMTRPPPHTHTVTTLPKVDTSCTALSLVPTIIGNTFAASLRTDISPQRKEARPRSHALTSD